VVTCLSTYYMCTKFQRTLKWVVIFHVEHLWNDPVDRWHYSRVLSFRFRSLVFLVWSYASEDCQDRAKFARFGH